MRAGYRNPLTSAADARPRYRSNLHPAAVTGTRRAASSCGLSCPFELTNGGLHALLDAAFRPV
ncbi:hypothetical protein BVI1335_530114 [Burkholderia vietnamiensis]|nr:hypothetical protein BVI1335_530114 [Burkholderia vietnamiensis]